MATRQPKVSRKLCHFLDRFESAVRADEMRGAADAESRGEIELDYQYARLDLMREIASLESSLTTKATS